MEKTISVTKKYRVPSILDTIKKYNNKLALYDYVGGDPVNKDRNKPITGFFEKIKKKFCD